MMSSIQINSYANGRKYHQVTARLILDAKKPTLEPYNHGKDVYQENLTRYNTYLYTFFIFADDGYIDTFLLLTKMKEHEYLLLALDG